MNPTPFRLSDDPDGQESARLYAGDATSGLDAVLVLAHGAGAGQTHPFMVRFARGLAARGVSVITFDFPYMRTGRRTPDRAPVLEEAFRRVVENIATDHELGRKRLMIGGKSMGGRMATHLAATPDAWPAGASPLGGAIVLGYPLNPPGGARRQDRVSHLFKINVPTLIVQGTRDSFGGPADLKDALAGRQPMITIHAVDGGDHSFAVPKTKTRTQAQVDEGICDAIVEWIRQGA